MPKAIDYTVRVPQITAKQLLAKYEQVDGVVWPVDGTKPMAPNITIAGETFTHKHVAYYIRNPHLLPDIPIKRMALSRDILDRYFRVENNQLVNKKTGALVTVDTVRLGPQYKSISRTKAIRYLKGKEAARVNAAEALKSQKELLEIVHNQNIKITSLEAKVSELFSRLERLAL